MFSTMVLISDFPRVRVGQVGSEVFGLCSLHVLASKFSDRFNTELINCKRKPRSVTIWITNSPAAYVK